MTETAMDKGFEYTEMKGWNVRNAIVTIVCTASIVASVCLSYSSLKSSISDLNKDQVNSQKITDLRLIELQEQINIINHRIDQLEKPDNSAKK